MGYSAKRAGDKTQAMSRDIDGSRRKSKAFAAGWGKMVGVVAGVTAAIGAASGAFQLLGNSINEARSARKAMAQTAAVMKSMGRTEAPKRINKMIDQLSSMSGIDDDALREMTNVMLTFGNVQGKTFEKANGLALDLVGGVRQGSPVVGCDGRQGAERPDEGADGSDARRACRSPRSSRSRSRR
jgi:hypothetical protein